MGGLDFAKIHVSLPNRGTKGTYSHLCDYHGAGALNWKMVSKGT